MKKSYVEIKLKNSPSELSFSQIYALIARIAGKKYADSFIFEKREDDGFDFYEVYCRDGKIVIKSSTGVGFASGFNAYLKECCGYSVGALSTSGALPDTPPRVKNTLKGKSKFLYRYFFNYCTFSYTYAFDTWEEWERTLDYLILSGYNLCA